MIRMIQMKSHQNPPPKEALENPTVHIITLSNEANAIETEEYMHHLGACMRGLAKGLIGTIMLRTRIVPKGIKRLMPGVNAGLGVEHILRNSIIIL